MAPVIIHHLWSVMANHSEHKQPPWLFSNYLCCWSRIWTFFFSPFGSCDDSHNQYWVNDPWDHLHKGQIRWMRNLRRDHFYSFFSSSGNHNFLFKGKKIRVIHWVNSEVFQILVDLLADGLSLSSHAKNTWQCVTVCVWERDFKV